MKAALILWGSAAMIMFAAPALGQGLLALSGEGKSDYKENVPLTMSLNTGVGFDSIHYQDPSQQSTDSVFLQGGVGLIYQHNDHTTKFSVNGEFDTLYYFDPMVNGDHTFYNSHVGVNYSQQINRRLSITDNFYLAYEMQPDYAIGATSTASSGQYLYGYNNFAVSYAWSQRFSTSTGYTIEGIHYNDSDVGNVDDRLSHTFSQVFSYRLSRKTTLVGEYRFDLTNYKSGGTAQLANPDYTAHYALVGVDQAWSPRLNASARAGAEFYLSDRGDRTEPYFESSLTWAMSRTSSLRWYTQLGFDGSELGDYSARYSFRTGLVAARQFTERLSGNVSLNYVHSEFDGNDVVSSGNDNEVNAGIGVDYKLWRHVTLKANYSYTTISSDIDFRDYDRHYATVLLNATF